MPAWLGIVLIFVLFDVLRLIRIRNKIAAMEEKIVQNWRLFEFTNSKGYRLPSLVRQVPQMISERDRLESELPPKDTELIDPQFKTKGS